MVISESKKKSYDFSDKEQDKKLTDMAKQKVFKICGCGVSYRRICKKGIRTKK